MSKQSPSMTKYNEKDKEMKEFEAMLEKIMWRGVLRR